MNISNILEFTLLNNSILMYLKALAVFLALYLLLKFFRVVVAKRLRKFASRTKTDVDDFALQVLDSIGDLFYIIIAIDVSSLLLNVSKTVKTGLWYVTSVIVLFFVLKAMSSVVDFSKEKIIKKKEDEDKKFDPHTMDILSKIIKWGLWIIGVMILLQNLGYNISALVAGLGIGGIAIAFALQNVLVDMFASFSIYFDKPFQIGDFIVVGKDMGTIKKIGIKSTRIQALQGQELIISNKELTEARINNYKRLRKRRVVFNFNIIYETTHAKLNKIPSLVGKVINKVEKADFDRAHLKSFGDSGFLYEIVYYALTSDYALYMDIQEEINLEIKKALEKEKIQFAYPTQTIHLAKK